MVFPKSKRGWNTNPVHPHLTWAWRRVDAGRRALNLPEQMAIFIDSPSFTTVRVRPLRPRGCPP